MNVQQPDYAAIFPGAEPNGEKSGFSLRRHGSLLLGHRTVPARDTLRAATTAAYRDLFQAVQGYQLYRIWNQVPAINEIPPDTRLERYRSFSAGRADAFESQFGPGFNACLPAASAVGTDGEELTIAFVAGPSEARHFENPDQVPAYRYPIEHGPRSPSFARATCVSVDGRTLVFISGTAAIKGHATIAEDSLARQIDCTFDNLHLISAAAGVGSDLGRGVSRRLLRIYLRSGADRAFAEAAVQSKLLQPGDTVEWRQADLCRAALKIEIEASLVS
ncbi:MAG TPA: hypothetical protein VGL42_14050 [Opitutaceae bacterium]